MKMDEGGSERLYRWPQKGPNKQPLVIKKIYNGVYQPISIFLYICYQSIYSSFPSIHLLSIWIIVIPRCYSISDGLVTFLKIYHTRHICNIDQSCICVCVFVLHTLRNLVFEVLVPLPSQKHSTCHVYLQF